ncbi:T-cell surface glycoprotein CD4 [Lissotriton helveticus]
MDSHTRKSKSWLTALCLLLGIQPGLNQEVMVTFARVASEVTLKCETNSAIESLKWEKENNIILQLQNINKPVLKGQSELAKKRSHINLQQINQRNCSMRIKELKISDAGLYMSTANSKEARRVQLVLFEMTSPDSKALLVSDNLELLLEANPATISQDVSITCKNPRDTVKGTWKISQDQNLAQKLHVKDLQLEDNGDWRCKISTVKASLELPYKVTVAGLLTHESGPAMLFSRNNDTVLLPFLFNFNIRDSTTSFPKVTSGGLYRSDGPSELGQKKTTLTVSQDGVCWSNACGQRPPMVSASDLSYRLPGVQFDDAGWYTLLVGFTHKELKKTFHLSVLRVAASPKGPVAPESRVNLVCEVSNHSNETVLRWTQVNGSLADTQEEMGAGTFRITLQMFPQRFGLWQCSLYKGEKLLQTADYELVEKRNSALFGWWVWAAGGALALALLLVIVCAVVCVARSRLLRRRARRVAWLKKHRTCQCNDRLNKPLNP